MKLACKSVTVPGREINTLVWAGDDLIDPTKSRRFKLDGTSIDERSYLSFPFDRGLFLQDLEVSWTIVYENRGTKALLFKNSKIHRELNRTFYFAKTYDYPVAFAKTVDGRVVVIYCPDSYDTLQFEDAETGEVLGVKTTSGMEFHSRLAVSADCGHLVSAGWFWHPLGGAWLCSLDRFVGLPSENSKEVEFGFGAEIDSVAFLGNDRLVVSTSSEVVNSEVPANGLGPMQLGVWSLADGKWASIVSIEETTGMMMPWRDWVISFYGHPKAIDLATGAVVHRWDHIYSGRQVGAIELGEPAPPPLALDAERGRFAVAGSEGIFVISLDISA